MPESSPPCRVSHRPSACEQLSPLVPPPSFPLPSFGTRTFAPAWPCFSLHPSSFSSSARACSRPPAPSRCCRRATPARPRTPRRSRAYPHSRRPRPSPRPISPPGAARPGPVRSPRPTPDRSPPGTSGGSSRPTSPRRDCAPVPPTRPRRSLRGRVGRTTRTAARRARPRRTRRRWPRGPRLPSPAPRRGRTWFFSFGVLYFDWFCARTTKVLCEYYFG
mmetsp:Transcript_20880/g.60782  ORF Transcript_20880/g.60782 Transcript_20880/m.60782 type:complete len:219 (-) Transcript_20880:157-813(-)